MVKLPYDLEKFLVHIYRAEQENPNRDYIDTDQLEPDQRRRIDKIEQLRGFLDIQTPPRTSGPRYVRLNDLGREYCQNLG